MQLPIMNQPEKTRDYATRPGITRRSFLRTGTAATGAVAAIAASLSPLRELTDTDEFSVAKFIQKHYKEMDGQDMASALERINSDSINDAPAKHQQVPV